MSLLFSRNPATKLWSFGQNNDEAGFSLRDSVDDIRADKSAAVEDFLSENNSIFLRIITPEGNLPRWSLTLRRAPAVCGTGAA